MKYSQSLFTRSPRLPSPRYCLSPRLRLHRASEVRLPEALQYYEVLQNVDDHYYRLLLSLIKMR